MFHLVTHAFFKALLFLGSGSVIYAMHAAYHPTHSHEDAQDMRNMGGLKKYMPITWVLMWIATLAIAGIPPFAGFFSKDEILGAVFVRARARVDARRRALARHSGQHGAATSATCSGSPRRFMTAIYMTRMMLYTFHGPNRTGEKEREHLHEAPWVMTGPLVVLGVLSAFGGWFNLPSLLPARPVGVLEHWLEPVVGEGALRITQGRAARGAAAAPSSCSSASRSRSRSLGIAIAFVRGSSPRRSCRRTRRPRSTASRRCSPTSTTWTKLYDAAIVQPVVATSRNLLWRGIDVGLIDGLTRLFVQSKDDDSAPGTTVPMGGLLPRAVGWIGSQMQSGQVGTYAWVLVVGVLFVLGAFTFR